MSNEIVPPGAGILDQLIDVRPYGEGAFVCNASVFYKGQIVQFLRGEEIIAKARIIEVKPEENRLWFEEPIDNVREGDFIVVEGVTP
jgi:hypothetical protein